MHSRVLLLRMLPLGLSHLAESSHIQGAVQGSSSHQTSLAPREQPESPSRLEPPWRASPTELSDACSPAHTCPQHGEKPTGRNQQAKPFQSCCPTDSVAVLIGCCSKCTKCWTFCYRVVETEDRIWFWSGEGERGCCQNKTCHVALVLRPGTNRSLNGLDEAAGTPQGR